MRSIRFQFTLGQLIAVIAACAVVFAVVRFTHWSLLLATVLVLPGFAYDRARAGSGILGAMLAGMFTFECGLFALNAYLILNGAGSVFEFASLGAMTTLVGLAGLTWGTVVGLFAWFVLLVVGRSLRSRSAGVEPPAPTVRRGTVDRGLEIPVSRGHRPWDRQDSGSPSSR